MARFVAQYVVGSGGRSYTLAFDPEAILVVNPTSKTVYVRFGALDVPNTTERSDFFVLPRMAGVFPIKSPARSFAIGDGDPVVDPQPGEDGRCQIIVVAGEPIPALSPLPITYVRSDVTGNVNATVEGTIDANVTNSVLPVSGSVNANVTNSVLPVSGSVNATVTNTNLPVTVLNVPMQVEVTNWPAQTAPQDPTSPPDGPTTISVGQLSWREWRPNDGKSDVWTVNLNRASTYQDVVVAVSMYPSFGECRIRIGSKDYYYASASSPRAVVTRSFWQETVNSVSIAITRPSNLIRAHAHVLFRDETTTPVTLQTAEFPSGSVTLTSSYQLLSSTAITSSLNRRVRGLIRFTVSITGTSNNFIRFALKTPSFSSYSDFFDIPILTGTYTIYAFTEPFCDTNNPTMNLYCKAVNPITDTVTVQLIDSTWQYYAGGASGIGDVTETRIDTLRPGQTSGGTSTASYPKAGMGFLKISREGWVKLTRSSSHAIVLYAKPDTLTPFPACGETSMNFGYLITNLNDYSITAYWSYQIEVP